MILWGRVPQEKDIKMKHNISISAIGNISETSCGLAIQAARQIWDGLGKYSSLMKKIIVKVHEPDRRNPSGSLSWKFIWDVAGEEDVHEVSKEHMAPLHSTILPDQTPAQKIAEQFVSGHVYSLKSRMEHSVRNTHTRTQKALQELEKINPTLADLEATLILLSGFEDCVLLRPRGDVSVDQLVAMLDNDGCSRETFPRLLEIAELFSGEMHLAVLDDTADPLRRECNFLRNGTVRAGKPLYRNEPWFKQAGRETWVLVKFSQDS